MAEFPEARIRLRSGLEWADQKTVMEAWSAAPEELREQFAARVDGVSDADLLAVCEDLVAAVHVLQAEAPATAGGGEQDPPHDPPSGAGDEATPDPEPAPKPRPRRPRG